MGTYWNNNGKYQEWVDKINDTMPSMYDTDNYYMNVFIAFSSIYYDIYNNGGGNIEDGCYDDNLRTLDNFLGLGNFNWYQATHDLDYLEDKANEIFEKLMEQDLSFENHGFWNEWKERKISMEEQKGKNWLYISCGTMANTIKEFNNRKQYGFAVV